MTDTELADNELEDIIDKHLPNDWKRGEDQKQQIIDVTREFLYHTEKSQSLQDRRKAAQWAVAEDWGIEINGVQQKCGQRTWENHVEDDEYNPRHFSNALADIESEVNTVSGSKSYFWVNTGQVDWNEPGEELFYSSIGPSGSPRRNQSAFERAKPGDEALIYRMTPVKEVAGRAQVTAGLHEGSSPQHDEPVEGITIEWQESLDGISWKHLNSRTELADSTLIESDNNYVVSELTKDEYETILRLASENETEPNHFWVTSSPALWDIDDAEEGSEVFYTAYNPQGRKRRLFQAFESARPGDKVLFYESSPTQQIVGEGTVVTELHKEHPKYRDEPIEGVTLRYENKLDPVYWQTLTELAELQDTTVLQNNARGALFPLSETAYQAIRSVGTKRGGDEHLLSERVSDLRARLSPPEVTITLPEELYFEDEEELRRQIGASLNSGKHIIFTGPPGTGKTKLAKHVCETVVTDHNDIVDDYKFTTATAEWTTFDTIGGYIPNRSAEGDELVFQPRLFLDRFRQGGAIKNEWLVIDEINRSDIDKAFGQLFSVLSGDSVQLPYEREAPIQIKSLSQAEDEDLKDIITDPDIFPVTPSWRLLATMNTYDKTSLYELSYAFMRRFNFIHVGVPSLIDNGRVRTSLLNPTRDQENYATGWIEADSSLRVALEETFEELAVVWYKVNKHQVIGPSIVRDILRYLAASGSAALDDPGPALTDAVIALVFPQLEGMAPQEQRRLVDSLTDSDIQTEAGPVDLELDGQRLKRKAEDFFDLPPQTDE